MKRIMNIVEIIRDTACDTIESFLNSQPRILVLNETPDVTAENFTAETGLRIDRVYTVKHSSLNVKYTQHTVPLFSSDWVVYEGLMVDLDSIKSAFINRNLLYVHTVAQFGDDKWACMFPIAREAYIVPIWVPVEELQEEILNWVTGECEYCGSSFTKLIVEGDPNTLCKVCATPTAKEILGYSSNPPLKIPKNEKELFGVELELEAQPVFSSTEIFKCLPNRLMFTFVKYDGSLRNGCELVTHPLTYEQLLHTSELTQALKSGAIADKFINDNTCGMHVHISRTSFDNSEHMFRFAWAFSRLHEFSTYFSKRQVSKLRRWSNWQSETELTRLSEGRTGYKYVAVNFNHSKTLEVRFFKSTVKYEKFMSNVEFVRAIKDLSKTTKVDNIKEVFNFVKKNATVYPHLLAEISTPRNKYIKTFRES